MLDRNGLPQELLSIIRKKTKLRNAFENNISTNIKHSKAHIKEIIQPGGF